MISANATTNELGGYISDWKEQTFTVGTAGHGAVGIEFNKVKLYPAPKELLRLGSSQQSYANLIAASRDFPASIEGFKMLTNVDYSGLKKGAKIQKWPSKFCLEGKVNGVPVRILASSNNTRYGVKIGGDWVMYRSAAMVKRKLNEKV